MRDQRWLRGGFAAGVGLGADDGAFRKEFVGHIRRRRQQAAGVVAEIHDDRLGVLLFHFVDGFVDLVAGALGEVGDAEISDLLIGIDEIFPAAAGQVLPAFDGGDFDFFAADRVILFDRAVLGQAADGQCDGCAFHAGDGFHGLVDRDAASGSCR